MPSIFVIFGRFGMSLEKRYTEEKIIHAPNVNCLDKCSSNMTVEKIAETTTLTPIASPYVSMNNSM